MAAVSSIQQGQVLDAVSTFVATTFTIEELAERADLDVEVTRRELDDLVRRGLVEL